METGKADLSALKIDRTNKNVDPEKRGRIIKKIGIPLFLVLLAAFVIWGYGKVFEPKPEVTLATVVLQNTSSVNAVLNANGYIVAQRKAAVASKGTGRLVYLGFVEGDKVKKNEIIGKIEDSDIKAALEQAKANLKLAEADLFEAENNYNRVNELLKSGVSTPVEADAAKARYLKVLANIEVAKAGITSAEVALENTLIRAPFDGTVLTKNADIGEIVAPLGAGSNSKSAVVTLADMSSLQVEADVSESNIQKISSGQECMIYLDAYPDKGYSGYVDKIVPTADRAKATVKIKVGFRNYDGKVLPEMGAKVSFMSDKEDSDENEGGSFMVIPSTAIRNKNNKSYVYLVEDSVVREVEIGTGKTFGEITEIINGLNEGDSIIDQPDDKIRDGVKVKTK